jgi:Ca2+-binding EF-hand superfamily protein
LDKDGLLNKAEFDKLLASFPRNKLGDERTDFRDLSRDIMERIDKNKDGLITQEELYQFYIKE